MAKVKKGTAKKKAVAQKERATSKKGGLKDKIAWVEKHFCQKGKSKTDAVKGLMDANEGMSINYARTIVYSYMKDSDFAPSSRKSASPKSAGEKKKKASTSSKKAASKKKPARKKPEPEVVEDDFDDEDDDDFDF